MSDETVLIASKRGGGGSSNRVYHTDPDCVAVRMARNVREYDLEDVPEHFDECGRCTYDASAYGSGRGHLESLKEAAKENTR